VPEPELTICASFAWMALQLMILPHMPRTGIQGHVRISLMRPNCMKQVLMIADGLNFKSFIAATQCL
jgi:hypothetical protein